MSFISFIQERYLSAASKDNNHTFLISDVISLWEFSNANFSNAGFTENISATSSECVIFKYSSKSSFGYKKEFT